MKILVVAIAVLAAIVLFTLPPKAEQKPAEALGNTPTVPEPGPQPEPSGNATRSEEPEEPAVVYEPRINPADFTTNITNRYLTFTPGMNFTYEGETEDGTERIVVLVLNETRTVAGVTTLIVWDRVWLDGDLTEDTKDWYAQDKEGNVWYFGEDSKEIVGGAVASTAGSWESGVDGAKPGIVMEADPKVGDSYRQEYYEGEAEDMADVIALGVSVTVPYGTFQNCLKTRDWTPLEPGADEYKYYCLEIGGVVLEQVIEDGEKVELINVSSGAEETLEPGEPLPVIRTEITEEEARAIALTVLNGTITDVAIEKKHGKTAYVVEMQTGDGEQDVIIDIKTGEVLGIE